MHRINSLSNRSWRSELTLEFERRQGRTVLGGGGRDGPLVVQKPLYPEGDQVCHAIIVHPPAGIAGGDELEINLRVGAGACVVLTTPGAGKWYRSAGQWARQENQFAVGAGGAFEWLPQETIVFDRALGQMSTKVLLEGDGCFIGWEIFCLGRTGSGERFSAGEWHTRLLIQRDGKPLWFERLKLRGGDGMLESSVIMGGQPVCGTMIAASARGIDALLDPCRAARPMTGTGAVTALPGLLVGRYLGASSEAAKNYFIQLWRLLRPSLTGRAAVEPRIWRT